MLRLLNSVVSNNSEHADTINKFLDNNARLDERLNALEGNFSNLTQNINTQFQSLNAKFDERGKPRYELIGVGVTIVSLVFSALWILAFNPINASLAKLETNFDKLNSTAVTSQQLESVRSTIEAKFKSEREILDLWEKYSSLSGEVSKNAITKLEAEIVPRREHEVKWRSIDDELAKLNHELHTLLEKH